MSIDLSKLSQQELLAFAKIVKQCDKWAEATLCNPDETGHPPLVLNTVERMILSSKKRRNIIKVHRRAGKSYSLCIRALWRALTHESSQVLIICPDQPKVDALFELMLEFIRVSPGLDSGLKGSQKRPAVLTFHNGSTIKGFTTGAASNREANVLRGQTADEVIVDEAAYLAKGDWKSITPIMYGDATRENVICWVASTPTAERGKYYDWCVKDQSKTVESERWNRIFMALTENPDYPADKVAKIRSDETEAIWLQEWEAQFPDVGEGVFRRSYIDRAARSYDYFTKDEVENPRYAIPNAIRTMGVDWDKFHACPNIIILELDMETQKYKVCYWEEIPMSKFTLGHGVERIIFLDARFNCYKIFVDRGYGERQLEELHQYGLNNPRSGLDTKVEGFTFSDYIEVIDPIGEKIRKPIKPFLNNILVKWMEDDKFSYSKDHEIFKRQLEDYKVLGVTNSTVKYSDGFDHIIASCSLAAYAMYKNFGDPFKFEPAQKSHVLPVPKFVRKEDIDENAPQTQPTFNVELEEVRIIKRTFSRGQLPKADSDFSFKRGTF